MLLDSEWNEAKAFFYRIHLAISASDDAALRKDSAAQLLALYTLHRELMGQMKDEELEEATKLYMQANKIVNLSNRHRISNVLNNSVIKRLYDYELYLRQVMKKRKMDLPRQRDPGAALMRS